MTDDNEFGGLQYNYSWNFFLRRIDGVALNHPSWEVSPTIRGKVWDAIQPYVLVAPNRYSRRHVVRDLMTSVLNAVISEDKESA
jgi:hypothetical protein